MISASQIVLAAEDRDPTQLFVILALVAMAVIGKLIQKANEAKQRRNEREAAQRRPQRARPQVRTPDRQAAPPVRPQRLAAAPPAVRKTARRGLKPNKTSVESRRIGSAHVGSADVGRLAHDHVAASERTAEYTIRVDLSDVEAARRAILLHEIFSAPKALREDAELWET